MNQKIKLNVVLFSVFGALILSLIFKMVVTSLHISESNIVAINVLQVLYRVIILGIPLLGMVLIKNNENYILSIANESTKEYGWKKYFYVRSINFLNIFGSILVAIITICIGYFLKTALYNLYYGITGKVFILGENLLIKSKINLDINSIIIALISLVLIPSVLEELLFRGSVYNAFKGNKLMILFSTITFALLHQDLNQLILAIVVGIVCSIVIIMTENASITIFIHMICNLCSIFVLDQITLPFDLENIIKHEEKSMALYYSMISVGLFFLCILVLWLVIKIMFVSKDCDKKEDKENILSAKDKLMTILIMVIYIVLFIVEVI